MREILLWLLHFRLKVKMEDTVMLHSTLDTDNLSTSMCVCIPIYIRV